MGPDQYTTREEFDITVDFLLSKIHQQGKLVVMLVELLESEGILNPAAALELSHRLEASEASKQHLLARAKLVEFSAIHKAVRRILDQEPS